MGRIQTVKRAWREVRQDCIDRTGSTAMLRSAAVAALAVCTFFVLGMVLGMPARGGCCAFLACGQTAWILQSGSGGGVQRNRRGQTPRARELVKLRRREARLVKRQAPVRGRLVRALASAVLIAHHRLANLSCLDRDWLAQEGDRAQESSGRGWSSSRSHGGRLTECRDQAGCGLS